MDVVQEEQQPSAGSDATDKDKDKAKDKDVVTISKIQELLQTKNDTSRFVGLALLKSVLDNSAQLRQDEAAITGLWKSVSPRFLDRLLRTASRQSTSSGDAKDMMDIAVAVLHTFSLLLPHDATRDSSLVGRIPALVSVVLYSSDATTELILQTLLTLVSSPEGAREFVAIDDASALIEIAPSQPLVLDVFLYAYSQLAVLPASSSTLRSKVNSTVQSLVVSFKGTDAVTLLGFLDSLLRRVDAEIFPSVPSWLKPVTDFIRALVTSKPTANGRAAYTNLSASLLQTFPDETSKFLFSDGSKSEKPFPYLLINLVMVDLRASFPSLLAQLNSPDYESTSLRLASAFDIVSAFVGFLLRSLDDDDLEGPLASLIMAPDLLLKLRKTVSETMSLAIEYLRDRWDASVTGAMGLHPEARVGAAKTSTGSHYTLAWDGKTDNAHQDPLILAAVRALAIWLREDDNDSLRKEAAALSDMFMDLYKSSASGRLDFRRPVLVALEGVVTIAKGIKSLLENEAWETLVQDMLSILQASSSTNDETEAARGIEIIRVLLPIVESERPGSRETWMAVITTVAAWDVPEAKQPPVVSEFEVAVLQLATALLSNTHPTMQRRYTHSISAILGIAKQLKSKVAGDASLSESLLDVERTLSPLR